MTTAEYLTTPETPLPRELAFGTLRVADAPLVPHQWAVGRLFLALHAHVREHRLGEIWLSPIDVVLDADRALVVQPDLAFVSNARRHIVQDRLYGAPDVAIEVLSPDPRVGDIDQRLGWFARYGVRECWLLHQLESVLEVIAFDNGAVMRRVAFSENHRIDSAVLPRFEGSVDAILERF